MVLTGLSDNGRPPLGQYDGATIFIIFSIRRYSCAIWTHLYDGLCCIGKGWTIVICGIIVIELYDRCGTGNMRNIHIVPIAVWWCDETLEQDSLNNQHEFHKLNRIQHFVNARLLDQIDDIQMLQQFLTDGLPFVLPFLDFLGRHEKFIQQRKEKKRKDNLLCAYK